MRAKEYLFNHTSQLQHSDILSKILNDLLPLRDNKEATDKYVSTHLFADKVLIQYNLQKNLYEQGNAVQRYEPVNVNFEDEINQDIAPQIRGELFNVIKEDDSFGYLFYILGRDYNTNHSSCPMGCVPDSQKIISAIKENRDNYPKDNLDEYLNEDLNYEQYKILMDNNYPCDEESLLFFFNTSYKIFDDVRLRKESVTGIKEYLKRLSFNSEVERIFVLRFVLKMLESNMKDDKKLEHVHCEILQAIEKTYSSGKDAAHGGFLSIADLPAEHHPDSRPSPLCRRPVLLQVLLAHEWYYPEGISKRVNGASFANCSSSM